MACLLSTTFPLLPLRPSPMLLLNKGVHQFHFSLDRLSSKSTTSTVHKIIGSCSSNKHILSIKGNCQRCLMSCTRSLRETWSYNLDVDYCTEIVISGYWVGPDPDDGWGFVEAVINQTT